MQQRRPLGLLMPTAMSQLWHKEILDPFRDLEIPSWSWAGVLWPSSAQPPRTHHWRLKMPSTSGLDSHHLCGAQGNSQWQESPLSHWHRATYSAMFTYSRKTKVSQVSVMGVDGLISTPWITKPLPCTLQDTPFSHSFLKISKCPTPILGRDLSKFSLCYYPESTFWSSLAAAP